jgi:NADH-quinone oxidoreductase subunit I
MRRREEMNFLERIYLFEIAKGVAFTTGKLVKNLTLHILQLFGLAKGYQASVAIQYPDQRRPYPERYRGRHRLTLKADDSVKCTACYLCATACPAKCIYIEPQESKDPNVEKFPKRYEIDTLLCIYCGYCVEACPVDAIRMDTGLHPEVYQPDPRLFIEDKEVLMQRSRDMKGKTTEQLYSEHLKKMQELEKDTI